MNVPIATSVRPVRTTGRFGTTRRAVPTPAVASDAPKGRTRAEQFDRTTRQQGRDDRRREHEIDKAERHLSDGERFADEHEVHICEGADEREQDAEPDREAWAQKRVAEVLRPDR